MPDPAVAGSVNRIRLFPRARDTKDQVSSFKTSK